MGLRLRFMGSGCRCRCCCAAERPLEYQRGAYRRPLCITSLHSLADRAPPRPVRFVQSTHEGPLVGVAGARADSCARAERATMCACSAHEKRSALELGAAAPTCRRSAVRKAATRTTRGLRRRDSCARTKQLRETQRPRATQRLHVAKQRVYRVCTRHSPAGNGRRGLDEKLCVGGPQGCFSRQTGIEPARFGRLCDSPRSVRIFGERATLCLLGSARVFRVQSCARARNDDDLGE